MDSEKVRKKFENARGKIERENGNYLVVGTAVLFGLIIIVGTSSNFQPINNSDTAVFGQLTQINYSSNQVSEDTVSDIAEAMNESGWEGSTSTARQLNKTWYRVNLSTDLPSDERLTLDEQYKIQTTMTVMHHRAFNESDNVILNIEARDGSPISRFIQ